MLGFFFLKKAVIKYNYDNGLDWGRWRLTHFLTHISCTPTATHTLISNPTFCLREACSCCNSFTAQPHGCLRCNHGNGVVLTTWPLSEIWQKNTSWEYIRAAPDFIYIYNNHSSDNRPRDERIQGEKKGKKEKEGKWVRKKKGEEEKSRKRLLKERWSG